MSENNRRTLETYDSGVETYKKGTVQETDGHQKLWLDQIVSTMSQNDSILEIGSAFGRDAKYLKEVGFNVDCTDGSRGFVDYLNRNGFQADLLNIVERSADKEYDLILACAVFLHFSLEDFRAALANVKESLRPNGRFAFSVKNGDGEEWSEAKMDAPRYFKYWREKELVGELANAGFEALDVQLLSDDKWLHVISEQA